MGWKINDFFYTQNERIETILNERTNIHELITTFKKQFAKHNIDLDSMTKYVCTLNSGANKNEILKVGQSSNNHSGLAYVYSSKSPPNTLFPFTLKSQKLTHVLKDVTHISADIAWS